jgi:UDP-N-acetyl-D-galactosamine dehydrogenase
VQGSRILVLGLTFKENCPDVRNTKVVDVIRELEKNGAKVDVHDPWADRREARHEYGISPIVSPRPGSYDAVVLAVAHDRFRALGPKGARRFGRRSAVLYDVKYAFPAHEVDGRL